MTPQQQQEWFARLGGSPEAGAFLYDVWRCVSTWDDLIDKDVAITPDQINDAFWRALITIPAGAFYKQWQEPLRSVGVVAVANWLAANKLEGEGNRQLGWFLRMSFVDLAVLAAFVNGGLAKAVQTAVEARTFLQDEEPLEDYIGAEKE